MRSLSLAVALVACGSSPPNGDTHDASTDEASSPIPDATSMMDAPSTMMDATIDAPDIDSIPWSTGTAIGYGVAFKDTHNPLGDSAFIAYGGYGVDLIPAQLWATALFRATLESRGVRYIWAVQGPAQADYSGDEIGNSKIAASLVSLVSSSTQFVLVVAHSSGAFVGQELLEQLESGDDPQGVTKNLVVYFALDGGGGITSAAIDRTRNAYFVSSHDGSTQSANYSAMVSLASEFSTKGGFYDNDATGSGCDSGAEWCVHMTMITTKPHDPTTDDVNDDYSDFAGRPVCTSYLTAKL